MLLTRFLPVFLGLVGTIMLIKLRFFFIIHPVRTFSEFGSEIRKKEVRRSFLLALAGTLGVGNIFGVALGIMIGGPGTLFWLLTSSFFAMIIKYSETILVFDIAKEGQGMWDVIENVFHKTGGIFSKAYLVFTLLLSLFMGALLQSKALLDVADQGFLDGREIFVLLLILLTLVSIKKKGKKIDKITEIIIPLTTIIYIIMCLCVISLNFSRFHLVIKKIMNSVFSMRSCITGVTILAIKEGFARGLLSNEAGVGTSALAHSSARGRSPHIAGIFAMLEVFFDTTLLCMLTGFAILMSIDDVSIYKTPMELVSTAFANTLGDYSVYILLFCILLFAYATLICWYFYGFCALSRISSVLTKAFPVVFIGFIALADFFDHGFIVSVIDVLLLLMASLTLSVIIKKRHRISELSEGERSNKRCRFM